MVAPENAASQPALVVTEITDPEQIALWTKEMYTAFVGTDNVLAETLFGLPSNVMPSEAQMDIAVQQHSKNLSSNPDSDGAENRYIQVIDAASGAMMGGAKWSFFANVPTRPARIDVTWIDNSTAKGKFEAEFAQVVMDEFHSRRVNLMNCPHALLHICFTSPDYERRGVSSALVRWGLKRADEEGWKCFTEASPRGRPVYARLGFGIREEVKLKWDERGNDWKGKRDVRWTFMERPMANKDAS